MHRNILVTRDCIYNSDPIEAKNVYGIVMIITINKVFIKCPPLIQQFMAYVCICILTYTNRN